MADAQIDAHEALAALAALNDEYIRCVVRADAAAFDRILADDFLCSGPDGALLDRAAFLERTRATPPLANMVIDDVRIRVMGDVAIIHGHTRYELADRRTGEGRYTDVWARRNGNWLAVSAHVTRLMV
jgi:ketosteroid isomerase-like protein